MKRSAWCLLVAMVAIAGCGDKPKPTTAAKTYMASTPTPTSAAATAEGAALPSALVGDWTHEFSGRNVTEPGIWTIRFTRSGRLEMYGPNGDRSSNTCGIESECGDMKILKADTKDVTLGEYGGCKPSSETTYSFSIHGDTLRLRERRRDCEPGREAMLDKNAWTRG